MFIIRVFPAIRPRIRNYSQCKQIIRNIRVHSGNLQAQTTLDVCANSEETVPGAFLWGGSSENQRLSNHLFALSEIRGNREDLVCKHSAFDVERERRLYTFEMGEQGDALALNPKGMLNVTDFCE